ncbi:MAG: CopD family protein [Burkholderiaceae bacterium]|nr:CopD family protein [Burkholderiaceae bacterium]
MPWLKLLHIGAVIVWCGALLYLPPAVAALGADSAAPAHAASRSASSAPPLAVADALPRWPVPRRLFIGVATPAALVAIVSGTAILLLHGPLAAWLLVKLAAVGLLVLGHAACGMLILRVERSGGSASLRGHCLTLQAALLLWLAGIAWLVLRKPML